MPLFSLELLYISTYIYLTVDTHTHYFEKDIEVLSATYVPTPSCNYFIYARKRESRFTPKLYFVNAELCERECKVLYPHGIHDSILGGKYGKKPP